MTIQDKQQEIIDEFAFFEDWTERYEYLISLGKSLPMIDDKYKVEDNLIKGCQSQVWLHADKQNGKIVFTADSDAILTKGIVSLLIRVFSDELPKNILESDTDFINTIGLTEHLSPTRANGLVAMLKQIKLYALGLEN